MLLVCCALEYHNSSGEYLEANIMEDVNSILIFFSALAPLRGKKYE